METDQMCEEPDDLTPAKDTLTACIVDMRQNMEETLKPLVHRMEKLRRLEFLLEQHPEIVEIFELIYEFGIEIKPKSKTNTLKDFRHAT